MVIYVSLAQDESGCETEEEGQGGSWGLPGTQSPEPIIYDSFSEARGTCLDILLCNFFFSKLKLVSLKDSL